MAGALQIMDTLFAGEIATELVRQLAQLIKHVYLCKSTARHLMESVEELLPIVQEIRHSGVELPQSRQMQLSELVEKLKKGLELANSAMAVPRWNVYRSMQLARRMERIDKAVTEWIGRQMQTHIMADVHHLRVESSARLENIERRLLEPAPSVPVAVPGLTGRVRSRKGVVAEMMEGLELGCREEVPIIGVGLRKAKERVKELLMGEGGGGGGGGGTAVGICGIGGSGKTTLAREICRDHQIRDYFNERIFFKTVSQSPDMENLKLELWENITGSYFLDSYSQITPWNVNLEPKEKGPILVILDDVWSLSELEELVFRIPGCKTLVISRFKFPTLLDYICELDLLREEEALALFCSAAFEQQSIPTTADKKLVKHVVEECKGLPLALKVIGASLRSQPPKIWLSAKNKLSRGESISETHEKRLLKQMESSIDCLSSKARECFLDLGSFPEDKKIPLDVLLNMWMETHDVEEEDAFAILVELSNKNLLTLVEDAQNRAGDVHSSYSELSVTQHDVLRDLALHVSNREALNGRKRLVMARKEDRLPKDWERNKDQTFEAQIVSIHTGEMQESDWFQMFFPKAEVLILNFSSGTYFLPPFIGTMSNLKALVMINYGTSCTMLHNLPIFTSLNNLRTVWFEKITVPPLPKTTVPMKNLRKASLVLCELTSSLKGFQVDLPQTFPRLTNLTIDHCEGLTMLPSSISDISSLEVISISNCHDLCELPHELGKLSSLQILRVYACPALKKLPQSICKLKRLRFLDISQCFNLRDLPEDVGHLTNLEKIDMRECKQLRSIPRSSTWLKSLDHVICDEEMALLWKKMEKDIPELRIQIAEECYNLDWLVE